MASPPSAFGWSPVPGESGRVAASPMENLRLERRPEARAFSVEMLLQQVRDGKIRIPDFQRPLRWRSTHVLELFDSVYRGFPVGDLLLFKRPADAALLRIGPVSVTAAAVSDAYFVVDGQQRITALAGAMLHPEPRPRGGIYALWFDLEEESFVCAQSVEPPPHWIPVNAVGDSFALLNWLNDWPYRTQRPDLVQRAIALGKALREYPIPAYIVEGASDAVLRLIFKRVNTSGVRMRESEVFEALFGAGGHRPLGSACARLQTQSGFGLIPDDVFLWCLKANEGLDLRRPITERESDATALPLEAIGRAEDALLRTIQFLSDDAGILHSKLLPSTLPLLVLSRFFHFHPRPNVRTRALLVRWAWRGAISGVHSDLRTDALSSLVELVDEDEFASAERLLETVPLSDDFPTASTPWNGGDAQDMMCVVALVHLGPRDLETGEVLSVDAVRALLDPRTIDDVFLDVQGEGESTVARRVLLPDRDALQRLPFASLAVLESHGLDQAAADALGRGDLALFIERRTRVLDPWLKRFFAERCALDESDRPPVAELIRRVEKEFAAP